MDGSCVDDIFIENVVGRYSDALYRVSFQYVRNTSDAEDVVQDVFLGLVDKLFRAGFESDEHMKAWLIRVTINKSKNLAKGNARRKRREAVYRAPYGLDGQAADLETALGQLSSTAREAVYLHYYEGYTAKEIAGLLGKTEKAVLKCLSRSRGKLKEYLSEEE